MRDNGQEERTWLMVFDRVKVSALSKLVPEKDEIGLHSMAIL